MFKTMTWFVVGTATFLAFGVDVSATVGLVIGIALAEFIFRGLGVDE